MRLVGATPRQISVISAVEATVAAVAGVAVGFALFFLFRPLLYPRPLHRSAPRPGRPLAAGDRRRARRDRRPDRRGRVRTPCAPPCAGIAARREPASVVRSAADRPDHPASRRHRFARLLRRRRQAGQQRRPASGVARGLRAHRGGAGPRRTVVHHGGLSTHGQAGQSPRHPDRRSPAPRQPQGGLPVRQRARARPLRHERSDRGAELDRRRASSPGRGRRKSDTLADPFCGFTTSNCPRFHRVASVPAQVLAELRTTPGVRGVTVVHQSLVPGQTGELAADSSRATSWRRRPRSAGAHRERRWRAIGYFLSNLLGNNSHASSTVWPSAHLSVASIARLPVDAVVVATDGSSGSIERARTALERAFPFQGTPVGSRRSIRRLRASSR